MFKSIITSVLLSALMYSNALNAQVSIDSTDLTNPPATSCTNTFYTVSGVMANTNYGYSGATVNVVGFNISIDMPYFSGFAPMPGLTPYSEDIDLGMLPVGVYNVSTSTSVDGILSATDLGTFEVVSCCPVVADFTLSSTTTCFPDMVWTSNLSTGASNYAWYIDGLFMTNDPAPGILPTVAGVHVIELVADDGNCADSMEINLELFIADTIDLGSDTTICDTDSLLLDVTTPMATYEWQDGSTGASFIVDAAGVYWVEVTDSNGCVSLDSITVSLQDCSVGLDEFDNSESILIYPNPAISTIQLLGADEGEEVYIYSLAGDLVATYLNTGIIDISSLQTGAYFVKIVQGNNTLTKRLIVQGVMSE